MSSAVIIISPPIIWKFVWHTVWNLVSAFSFFHKNLMRPPPGVHCPCYHHLTPLSVPTTEQKTNDLHVWPSMASDAFLVEICTSWSARQAPAAFWFWEIVDHTSALAYRHYTTCTAENCSSLRGDFVQSHRSALFSPHTSKWVFGESVDPSVGICFPEPSLFWCWIQIPEDPSSRRGSCAPSSLP